MALTIDISDVVTSLRDLQTRLMSFRESFTEDMEGMLDEALQVGEDAMHQRVQDAVTKTGEARAAVGDGVPGRVETGAMDELITHQVQSEGNVVSGYLGWLGPVAEYVVYQEYGTLDNYNGDLTDPSFGVSQPHGVPHMHALIDGLLIAKQQLKDSLAELDGKVFQV